MAIFKIVRVAFVIHSCMATVRAMLVGVSAGMLLVSLRHKFLSEMRLRCGRAVEPPSCALRFQSSSADLLNFVSPWKAGGDGWKRTL